MKQTLCFQKFVDNAQLCFPFTPQTNFPAHNLNSLKVMGLNPGYLLKSVLLFLVIICNDLNFFLQENFEVAAFGAKVC